MPYPNRKPRPRGAARAASGGAAARRAARSGGGPGIQQTYIKRAIKVYEVLDEEGLSLIENNADTVLEEIGIIFRDDPEALAMWKDAGADVKGDRVHFPKGLPRSLLKTAPSIYTQHARNPERSVQIGGNATVFAPVYGPPFVRDLDGVRRYATIEDFRNFVKLAYMAPSIHHSGGTVCEPVDVPVNKRHLDMVYSHIKYSDKPFMGSVTAPERAEDTVAMAKIVFGDDYRREQHGADLADQRQLADGVRRHHARRAQGLCPPQPGLHRHALHPGRRDEPGDGRRHADAGAGRSAGRRGVDAACAARRAGAVRHLRLVDLDAVGRADLRHAGAVAGLLWRGAARAPARPAVPHRRLALRLQDPGRAGRL